MTISVSDLVQINDDVYKRYDDSNHQLTEPKGFKELKAASLPHYDIHSNHSSIALYNEETRTLLICHRGSILDLNKLDGTKKDWLVNNLQVALGREETLSDTKASEYTQAAIRAVKEQYYSEPEYFIQTGHSKGGREAQMASKKLIEQGISSDCVQCVTFNAAPISVRIKDSSVEYNHINLRMYNGFLKSDLVSMQREKVLGNNINFHAPDIKLIQSPFKAHLLPSIQENLNNYPNVGKMEVPKLIQSVQNGLPVEGLDINIKQATGKLISHGTAPYPKSLVGARTFFAEIQNSDGKHKFWGKGVQEALIQSNVRHGDIIHLTQTGNNGKQNTWKAEVVKSIAQQNLENARLSGNPETIQAIQRQIAQNHSNSRATQQTQLNTEQNTTKTVIPQKTKDKGGLER